MSSLRRILASRRNGALSRGPVTPEGKRRSAMNALAHGLLADCVVLPGESRTGFQDLVSQYIERLQPADAIELGMIEEMAAAYWRLRRSWALEKSLLSEALEKQPDADPMTRLTAAFRGQASSPELALLHRYETRLHVMFQRALHNMFLLRAPEMRNEPSPISEHPGQAHATPPLEPPPDP